MRFVSSVALFALSVVSPAQQRAVQSDAMLPAAPGGAAGRSAQHQLEDLVAAARQGNALAFWEWLPIAFRNDINGLARDFGARIDSETWDRTWRLVRRLSQVAIDKERFVFGSLAARALLGVDARNATTVRSGFVAFFELLRELSASDLATIDGLRQFDGGAFLGDSGKPALAALLKLAGVSGNDRRSTLTGLEVRILEQSTDQVTVEFSASGRPAVTTQFTNVDGRWVPVPMLQYWIPAVGMLRQQLAATPAEFDPQLKTRTMHVLQVFEGMVRQFELADTQDRFNKALWNAMEGMDALATRPR